MPEQAGSAVGVDADAAGVPQRVEVAAAADVVAAAAAAAAANDGRSAGRRYGEWDRE